MLCPSKCAPVMIELSVGGSLHHTTLSTLLSDKESMLHVMFSGRWIVPKTNEGHLFIDRDGTHFAEVLNYLRGSLFLPNDINILEKLLEEARYYQGNCARLSYSKIFLIQIRGLIDRILQHDVFIRPVHIVYMLKGETKRNQREKPMRQHQPIINVFQLRHLRRERDSFLARTAQKLYENGAHHARILTIILGRVHDDLSSTNLSNSASFYTPATDRTAFADFDATITIGADLDHEISVLSLLRRGRARELLLTSSLSTLFHYLRTGEVRLHFCLTEFRKLLEKDYTRLTEEAASGTAIDTAREPRISWIDVLNQINTHSIIDDLVIPLITDVAEYFGLKEFIRITRESPIMKPKPFLRNNSI